MSSPTPPDPPKSPLPSKPSRNDEDRPLSPSSMDPWILIGKSVVGRFLNPTEMKALKQSAQSGTLQIRGELPLILQKSSDEKRNVLYDIFRHYITSSATSDTLSENLSTLTESDVDAALHHIIDPIIQKQRGYSEEYIPLPKMYGSDSFLPIDKQLVHRYIKYECSSNPSILDLIYVALDIHNDQECRFSKMGFLGLLDACLTRDARRLLSMMREEFHDNIADIFKALSGEFDKRPTSLEIQNELSVLHNRYDLSIIDILNKIHSLIMSVKGSIRHINSTAFDEAMRIISNRVRPDTVNSIRSHLWHFAQPGAGGERSFYLLKRILKEYFQNYSEIMNPLSFPPNKGAVHAIGHTSNESEHLSREQKEQDVLNKVEELIEAKVHNLMLTNTNNKQQQPQQKQTQNNRVCYACNSPQHMIKDCPLKNNLYCYASCFMHKNAKHSNYNCFLQKKACDFAANHSSHNMNECRRKVTSSRQNSSSNQSKANTVQSNIQMNQSPMPLNVNNIPMSYNAAPQPLIQAYPGPFPALQYIPVPAVNAQNALMGPSPANVDGNTKPQNAKSSKNDGGKKDSLKDQLKKLLEDDD